MKAALLLRYGAPGELVLGEAPKPAAGPGELLVRVRAAGLNPIDWKIRSGKLRWVLRKSFPAILGFDFSGEVEALGPGVSGFAPGEAVFGMSSASRGAYAEYLAVDAKLAAKKPARLDHFQAAGVPLAALTAWQALFEAAAVSAGKRVLVQAGAGGVGHFAVQFARVKSAVTAATASARNLDFLRGLGADQPVDYARERFEEAVAPVDMVLEALGGEDERRSWRVLKPGGTLVSLLNPFVRPLGWLRGRRGRFVLTRSDGRQLGEIAALLERGLVDSSIEEVFPLSRAADAHARLEQGRVRGKLVLDCG